jgi:hypothetical protein
MEGAAVHGARCEGDELLRGCHSGSSAARMRLAQCQLLPVVRSL